MSDLEARDDDPALVATKREGGPEDVGLVAAVVRVPFTAAEVVGVVDALGFLLAGEEALVLPLGTCEVDGGVVLASPGPGFFVAPPALTLALGPSVLSTGFGPVVFVPTTLLTAGLGPGLVTEAALLVVDLAVALVGLSLTTFCTKSCCFLSSRTFLLSAMVSAFSFSFCRFSSSFFFLSASCCSLSLLGGALVLTAEAVALGSVDGLLAAPEAAALLDTGLVVPGGLLTEEAGFFASS